MSLLGMLTDTATILDADTGTDTGTDPRGDRDRGTWADGATYRARFEQLSTTEALAGRDTATADWQVTLPADAVLDHRSRVRDQHGQTFTVVGIPARPTTPAGVHHLEVKLRAVVD